MHMKLGQIQDIRVLFDEFFFLNSRFWRRYGYTQIFEISAIFTDFRPLASFWNTTYRHLQIVFLETRDPSFHLKKSL